MLQVLKLMRINPKDLRATVWLGAVAVLSAAGSYFVVARNQHGARPVYRVGWESSPPFQEKREDGTPTGFAVELVREAARRRGITLEWVPSIGSEASLRSEQVDLWPLITITAERRQFLHISDPYLQHEHYVIVRANSRYVQLEDLAVATIAHPDLAISRRLTHQTFPNARLLTKPTPKDGIQEVCRGAADAAFVDEFGATSALLDGHGCGPQPLRVIWIPALRTQLGVGATFKAAAIADEIREEIRVMSETGELSRIMRRWNYYLPQHVQSMTALLQADKVHRRLIYTNAVFAGLFFLAVISAVYIRLQKNRIQREVTEREQAEKVVREWERKFRDMLEGTQLVAIIVDLHSGISFFNNYACALTGWAREELIGRPAKDVLGAGYLRQLEKVIEHPADKDVQFMPPSESTLLTKAGEQRWIQWTSTVLHDSGGRITGFASLGEDVTELKRLRAEAAIRETEERFRAIFQQAAIGVAQTDLEGNVTVANDRYCAILGFTREELVGVNFRSYTHPDDVEQQLDHLNRLLAAEIQSFSIEKRYVTKRGSQVWAMLNGSLIRDQDNHPKHFIFVVEDVTERKQTEVALRESEQRFRNMADTAPVMLVIADANQQATFFNKGWLQFTGRVQQQEIGTGWTAGVHPDDLKRTVAHLASVYAKHSECDIEYRLRRADGEYRFILCKGVPRFDADGTFVGYIATCIDVSDLKRAHDLDVTRQKLESIGVVAGGIAHDFNNLLGSIIADAQLADTLLPLDSPAREGIARVSLIAERASEIVRELLAYAGKESVALEAVDMSTLVAEMIELLKVSISKRTTLKTDLHSDLPAVRANVAQMRQVVLNLVTNASEALGAQGGAITIATSLTRLAQNSGIGQERTLPNGDYIRLEISDTGSGMSEEVKARIFDPFFTTKFAGRGLGLSVVQGIVGRHRGAIQVTSAPSQGTRFEVLFPSVGKAARVTEQFAPARADREAMCVGRTVLLVEDEASLRTPVSTMLRKKGYSVIEASEGVSAVELFRANQESIDVVLLDMTLPGKSGPEILSELHGIQPQAKVILTTAYSQQTALNKLHGLEGWWFIQKPYQLAHLLNLLHRVCSGEGEPWRERAFQQKV